MAWSLWLGLQASCSHQSWRGHGQSIGPGAAVVCFSVSCRGPTRHNNDLPPSKCEMAKVNCCRDQQLIWSLWLGLQASCSHQTWRRHGHSIGPGAAVVRLIVPCRGAARHTSDLPPSKCEMVKVNCCRDQQLPWSLWLGLQASCSHQTWRGHAQSIGPGAAVIRFIVSCRRPARHTKDLPLSKCEMAKVNCCRPLRPAVGLVALALPAGKLQPPNLA